MHIKIGDLAPDFLGAKNGDMFFKLKVFVFSDFFGVTIDAKKGNM